MAPFLLGRFFCGPGADLLQGFHSFDHGRDLIAYFPVAGQFARVDPHPAEPPGGLLLGLEIARLLLRVYQSGGLKATLRRIFSSDIYPSLNG